MAVMWAYIYYDDGAVAKAAALFVVLADGTIVGYCGFRQPEIYFPYSS